MSVFKAAGVSTFQGQVKVRFATDLIVRTKNLIKHNHTDIILMELPNEMTKPEIITYLKTTYLMDTPKFAEAIQLADEKYNNLHIVKSKRPVAKISLDAIKSRAGIISE